MKIPNKLKVGVHVFKVDCSKELTDCSGETDWKMQVIRICKTLNQKQKESTFIHEIFHSINTTFGNDKIEHALIDSLSEQLYQVLHDNKINFNENN